MSSRFHRPLHHESFGFILILGLVASIHAMAATLVLPALPLIGEHFGSAPETVQLTLSAFFIAAACGQLACGALTDRFGRRPVLLGGVALSALAGIGCTLAPTIDTLIGFRVLQGLGGAGGVIVARAIARDRFEGAGALKAMSAMSAILTIVPMVGPALAGLLLEWLSWRVVFGLMTLIALVLGALSFRWIAESLAKPDPRATDPRRLLRNWLEMIRRPECISFALMGGFMFGGMLAVISMVGFVVRDSFGLSSAVVGILLMLLTLGYLLGAAANTRLATRWPVRRILALTSSLALLAALGVLAARLVVGHLPMPVALTALVLPLLAFHLAFGAMNPTLAVMYLKPLPHIAGTAASLGAALQMLGGALFTWLAGTLYDGTPAAIGYCLLLVSASAFLIFRLSAMRYAPGQLEG